MNCPTCNGVMTQYVGFNEREPKPGTPFECVKGCVGEEPKLLFDMEFKQLTVATAAGPVHLRMVPRGVNEQDLTLRCRLAVDRQTRLTPLANCDITEEVTEDGGHYVMGIGNSYVSVPITPTLQTSDQQTQSQPATSAKAPTQPVWAPNTAKGLAQRGASAGSWKISLPDPDPGDSALRTHQPQGDSHPGVSGRTIQQLTDKARALSEQPIDPELVNRMLAEQAVPRIWIPRPGYETSTYTSATRSPSQTSAPATAPSCPPKDWTSD